MGGEGGGMHGVRSHPPCPHTGPKGLHFDTQYPSLGMQSVKLNFQTTVMFTQNQRMEKAGLCIKVGRGQGDGDIGTYRDACVGTWDLGTRDEGLEDIKYGTRGRVGRARGDVKYRDARDAGCE